MTFSQRFRELRKEKRMTQYDFFQPFGITQKTISNYEREISRPDLETLSKFADFFGVTTDYLLGNTDNRNAQVITEITADGVSTFELVLLRKFEDLSQSEIEDVFNYIDFLKAKKIKKGSN